MKCLAGILRLNPLIAPLLFGLTVLPTQTLAAPVPAAALVIPKSQVLTPITALPQKVAFDEQILSDRPAVLQAIDYSLQYLQTPKAKALYQRYPVKGITRDRVQRSLQRFRQLVMAAPSPIALQNAVQREFIFYRAAGKDNRGMVGFTGYFEPVQPASRRPTPEYRYPLYSLPSGFERWPKPHPTREELEGKNGLTGIQGRLRGTELVWLRDRLEAYLVQVQGSARLQLTDGTTLTIGVAGLTDQPYSSIGRELVKDGKLRQDQLLLANVKRFFQEHPEQLDIYLPRNRRFVFFRDTAGALATGSLAVPVTAERSIATDKSLMPPGALALIRTPFPIGQPRQSSDPSEIPSFIKRPVSRFVLDQDTGGAIVGSGRVDIFMGTGEVAGIKAGLVNAPGQLYYLLLKR